MPPDLSSTALPWYQGIRPSRTEDSAAPGCIDAALARQAARTPDRAVLVDESGYLTCGELTAAVEARAAARPGSNPGAAQDDPGYRAVCASAQLVLQYGPHAALNLSDAQLLSPKPMPGDPAAVFHAALGTLTKRR